MKKILIFLIPLAIFAAILLRLKFSSFRFPPPPRPVKEILTEARLKQMTLEEKVGALFMVGFNGTSLATESAQFMASHHFRSFLLLGKNIENPTQLLGLNTTLCQSTNLDVCLVAVDQEGGEVSRIKFGGMDQTAQAQVTTPEQAYKIAKSRGEILKSLGINMNLAPVVEIIRDKNSYLGILDRSFLGDDEQVYELSSAMIKGYQETGVIPVAKHFPGGLGRLSADPHVALPVLLITQEELNEDLFPFKKLVSQDHLSAIMSTHILYPQLDSQNPVTVSSKFITSILRLELGFEGVIVTDDLAMSGISETVEADKPIAVIAKRAFLAGHDLLLISHDTQAQGEAYEAILKAVQQGEIPESRLDESVRRIIVMSF